MSYVLMEKVITSSSSSSRTLFHADRTQRTNSKTSEGKNTNKDKNK